MATGNVGQDGSGRKPLSKRLRFSVFDRDGFTCCYCGRQPPAVTLVIDHIVPVANGGPDVPENLRTSCVECNAGKSDRPLGQTAPDNADLRRAQEALEAVEIAEAFAAAAAARESLRSDVCTFICQLLGQEQCLQASITGVIAALEEYGSEQVIKWLDLSAKATDYRREVDMMKYFYGILRQIRRSDNG